MDCFIRCSSTSEFILGVVNLTWREDSGKDLTDLPGVGAATAKKLKDAGLTTVAKIRKAGRDGLTAAGINTPTAARILKGVAQEAGTKARRPPRRPQRRSRPPRQRPPRRPPKLQPRPR